MDPHTGLIYDLEIDAHPDADPPAAGAKVHARDAVNAGWIDLEKPDTQDRNRLEEMMEKDQELVAVEAEAAQRARLGDRELRRRRQRRR